MHGQFTCEPEAIVPAIGSPRSQGRTVGASKPPHPGPVRSPIQLVGYPQQLYECKDVGIRTPKLKQVPGSGYGWSLRVVAHRQTSQPSLGPSIPRFNTVKSRNIRPLTAVLAFALSGTLKAAPLFPDVKDGHWATDAVAALAAKGLVEGYPDGTFKGDRAASRWELALIVARLLQKSEAQHATFATKAELDELRKLVSALHPELDALGQRVTNLEEQTGKLDKRVTELERITFYGSVDTRIVFQSFQNNGAVDSDAGRLGAGVPGGVPYLNYTDMVGTGSAAPLRPQLVGIIPQVDYTKGVALDNGTGFTSKAILGMNIKVSTEVDAGVEFAAYSSQGDSVIDSYWGVSAPYLSNQFTANAGNPNTPYTRMTLNQFWIEHKPSKTRLVVGNIGSTSMDSLVYAGQGNLGVFGPRRFPGYGFQVTGQMDTSDTGAVKWEVLGIRFGDGVRYLGDNYNNYVLSGNVRYDFKNGGVGFYGSRMAEEHPTGGLPLAVGYDNGLNLPYGASRGWTIRQWVNPPNSYLGQLPVSVINQIGMVPNTADVRPISGWSNIADNAVGVSPGAGNFGPSSQDTWGVNAHYAWPLAGKDRIRVEGRYAGSDYKPNRNSNYDTKGTALDVGLTAKLLAGDLNLGAEFLRVDPDYQPAAWFGNVLGGRPVKTGNFTGVFHLYDNGRYPHNRTGVRLNGDWKFDEGRGKLWAKGAFLQQTQTSLYDVRVQSGALGFATPTNDVIGFKPGFVDTIFAGFAHPNVYGSNSMNSFTSSLAPLENPRGKERQYEIGASHRWDSIGLTVQGSYFKHILKRNSSLSAALGGSQNQVDFKVDSFNLDAAFEVSKKWTIHGGTDWVHAFGHLDPGGLYNQYALATGQTNFKNIDSTQWIPNLGFDYDLNDHTHWTMLARHYGTKDGVSTQIQAGNAALGQIGSTTHPFSWSGWQVSSEFQLDF